MISQITLVVLVIIYWTNSHLNLNKKDAICKYDDIVPYNKTQVIALQK